MTSPASASSFRIRRITTGFVFTLSATCSDLRGSSPDQAIKLKTCTATANLLFVDISIYLGNHGPPFCNHYSYKFDFVNCLCVLDLEEVVVAGRKIGLPLRPFESCAQNDV